MIINLAVFIYEPLYWRVTEDVVPVVLFPSNRQLFNEILASINQSINKLYLPSNLQCSTEVLISSSISRVFLHGNATGELEQPRWRRRKRENKKKHSIGLTDKQEKNTWTCSALFGKCPCHCRTSDVVKLYWNGNTIVPLGPVQRYPDIFESANSSLQIQKFPCPQVSVFKSNLPVHTYSDSLSVSQLICKAIFGSSENFIASLFHW